MQPNARLILARGIVIGRNVDGEMMFGPVAASMTHTYESGRLRAVRTPMLQTLIFRIGSVDIRGSAFRALLAEINVRRRLHGFDDFGAFLQHRILYQLLLDHLRQLEFIKSEQAHHLY